MSGHAARSLVIVGAGGFAREVAQVVRDINAVGEEAWTFLGYVDDAPGSAGTYVGMHPVLGDVAWLLGQADVWAVIAVGNPRTRHLIAGRLADHRRWATLVHPRAWHGAGVEIGVGSVICAGACLTTDVSLGEHCHVNLNATVGHDVQAGAWITVNPGANVSGSVTLGDGVEIGTGAALVQGVSVNSWATVGAGAVVTRDVDLGKVVVGVPARPMRQVPPPSGWTSPGPASPHERVRPRTPV